MGKSLLIILLFSAPVFPAQGIENYFGSWDGEAEFSGQTRSDYTVKVDFNRAPFGPKGSYKAKSLGAAPRNIFSGSFAFRNKNGNCYEVPVNYRASINFSLKVCFSEGKDLIVSSMLVRGRIVPSDDFMTAVFDFDLPGGRINGKIRKIGSCSGVGRGEAGKKNASGGKKSKPAQVKPFKLQVSTSPLQK